MKATAIAHTNIALVKYWGKRCKELNLPAVGSISITLKDLFTRTTVIFRQTLHRDVLFLNNSIASASQHERICRFLDIIRRISKINTFAEIISENNFPTQAGLASSASGFAALTLAACRAAHLDINRRDLSVIARRGSGSAARSIFGGYVEMKTGSRQDGSDAYAVPVAAGNFWPLQFVIILTSVSEKAVGSTAGMELTASTSPFYGAWVTSSATDLTGMRAAIWKRDLENVGEIAEHNCLKMHALALTARPALIYWNKITVKVVHTIRQLRREGIRVYFTTDAGPHVMAICTTQNTQKIKQVLEQISGVTRVLITTPGPAAKIIEN
jgi:diphosphomevalonate decarboxylase